MAKNNQGFTLLELIISVVIIGIIATITFLGNSQTYLKRARDAQRKSDLQQIRSALEIYRSDQGQYPNSGETYQIQGCGNTCGNLICNWGSSWSCGSPSLTYMEKLPLDPKGVNYRYSSNGNIYTIEACLENSNDPQGTTPTLEWGGNCASNKVYQVKNP